jgi:hypothetical protein
MVQPLGLEQEFNRRPYRRDLQAAGLRHVRN